MRGRKLETAIKIAAPIGVGACLAAWIGATLAAPGAAPGYRDLAQKPYVLKCAPLSGPAPAAVKRPAQPAPKPTATAAVNTVSIQDEPALAIDASLCHAIEAFEKAQPAPAPTPVPSPTATPSAGFKLVRIRIGAESIVTAVAIAYGTENKIWEAHVEPAPVATGTPIVGHCADFAPLPLGVDFGIATSGHQIEGGNDASNWTAWKAKIEDKKLPEVKRPLEDAGKAADHWNHVDEDTQLLADLGVASYRMSVEWSRIEPREGEIDAKAVQHYRDEISGLLARGIRPVITLQHFSLPQWVAAKGGWKWDGMSTAFSAFARLVYTRIAPEAKLWVTIQEPFWHIISGYVIGVAPPAEKQGDYDEVRAPLIGLLKSHAAAFRALHEEATKAGRPIQVGMANHLRVFVGKDAGMFREVNRDIAVALTRSMNWAVPDAIRTGDLNLDLAVAVKIFGIEKKITIASIHETLESIKGTQDYLGLNYYSRDSVEIDLSSSPPLVVRALPNVPTNDLGWEIYPEGLGTVLRDAHEKYPDLDLHILENGIADAKDESRAAFIRDHLTQVTAAVAAGIPVKSYHHRALLDGYEWAEGFVPHFGFYEVGPADGGFKRTARPSAAEYRRILGSLGVCRDSFQPGR